MTTLDIYKNNFRRAIPTRPDSSVVKWAEENVILPGSARSEKFNSQITPWTHAPINCVDDGFTRTVTFVKPVQSGGSVVGEIALCRWISTWASGDLQYNWENDVKAKERWKKRIEKFLKATKPVFKRWPVGGEKNKATACLVNFAHLNLTVQGVFQPDNLDSDPIRGQVNEELHNWESGRLGKADRRLTAFWNSVQVNISNAGVKGDQLNQRFDEGTQEYFEVLCPGCNKFHFMQTEWNEKHPELGGLRYDSSKCKRPDGTYDYNKMLSTIRYQMPCGFLVYDEPQQRRPLSLSGRYSEPRNTGAQLSNRSFTYDGIVVDYIPFLTLIQEKHSALRALTRGGDIEPLKRYTQERECRFWDPEQRPMTGRIVLSSNLKKDRDGLTKHEKFFARFFALDRQQGTIAEGELPHWWLVIRDFLNTGDSILVFEGKVETDENVIEILDRHQCKRRHGCADSGDDTTHVYKFCLRYGINAIKGGKDEFYSHGVDGRKIFSPEKPLHAMLNAPPTCEDPLDEPQFWLYSKKQIRDRLGWLRRSREVKHEAPSDVSDDYKSHNEAEELRLKIMPDGSRVSEYVQVKKRNDLYVDECYIAMLAEMAGLIGAGAVEEIKPENN